MREIVNKSEDYYSFKDPQTLHLNYGQVGVLNYTKNETKFRQYRCYTSYQKILLPGEIPLGAWSKPVFFYKNIVSL